MTVQQSNFLASTSPPYINEKASTVSEIVVGCKATHVNHVALSGIKDTMSSTGASTVLNPSLSHYEQRRTFEWEMGKITSLNASNRAFDTEEKGTTETDEEIKRSPWNIIDFKSSSRSFNIFRFSPIEDNIELSLCDLADNYSNVSHVAGRAYEMKPPLNFDLASPTNMSNVGSCSPSSASSILRGSSKNIQSLDLKSCHRQLYVMEEQSQTKSRQYYTQCERISDQSTSQSQMWQFNKKFEGSGST